MHILNDPSFFMKLTKTRSYRQERRKHRKHNKRRQAERKSKEQRGEEERSNGANRNHRVEARELRLSAFGIKVDLGIPRSSLRKDLASSSGILRKITDGLVTSLSVFLPTCPPFSWRISAPKRLASFCHVLLSF
ncbi:hypothetical protein Tco_0221643 [Tanacetum coccineum]